MRTDTDSAPSKSTWADTLAVYLRPRVLIVMFLGFSSGLPLALSGSTLQVWAAESGVNLRTIGLFTIVGTPYTIKFLWAPLVDALDVPMLSRLLGRRRGWLVFSQILLMVAIALLALCDPKLGPGLLIVAALIALVSLSAFVGSVREATLLDRVFRDPDALQADVAEVMGPPFPMVEFDAPLEQAFGDLQTGPAVLVAKQGEVLGVLTRADLLEFLAHQQRTGA